MKSYCVILIHEIVKIIEPKPVEFISIVPFFQSSIGLWMLDASFDVFYFILLKKSSNLLSASNSPPTRIRRELSSRTTQTNAFFPS